MTISEVYLVSKCLPRLLVSMLIFRQASTSQCPHVCECNNTSHLATCRDQPGLDYIPTFPNDITKLKFTGNNLSHVNEATFLNLTTLNLEVLTLRHNNILSISSNALSSLLHLRSLDLSGNGLLNTTQVAACLENLHSTYITDIRINSFGWYEEPTDIYLSLSSYNITKLTMNRNYFKHLNISAIGRHLPNLASLDVSFNNVQNITTGRLPNMIELKLHHNYIDVDGMFYSNGYCNFPNLQILNLGSNFVNYFEDRFFCLDNLETLVLDKNPVKQIQSNSFVNLTSLKSLHLNNMGDRLFNIHKYAFKSESLNVLTFSKNHFSFTTTAKYTYFDADYIFSGIQNLEELDLSENYFNISDGVLSRMLSGLTNIRTLTIMSSKLTTIPSNIFVNMYHLEVLNLADNHMKAWSGVEVFGNISSLWSIRLDFNYINVVKESFFPESLIANLAMVNMTFNPFCCQCQNLWFRKWIDERPTLFSHYPNYYTCNNPPELEGTKLKDYFPSDSECNPTDTFVNVVASLALIGIFTVIVVSLIYKGRWHIRYWIYLYRTNHSSYIPINSDENYLYSGFVVYCDEDTEWVVLKFLKIVEDENGAKLCIHHRDFEVGKLIVDNIAENIAQSKKIILVMSAPMIQSDWCLFEIRMAQRKFLNDGNGSLIIIMLENVLKKDMPQSLRNLIDITTYITWSEDPYVQERFWTNVVNAIKAPY